MQVNKNNITQFLTATNMCFMIPVYQRNYDWGEEQCKQLWSDISYLAKAAPERTHFLGTICSKTVNGHEKTIIDGQQRITTITLLMKAMHDYVSDQAFKQDINSNYLRNMGYGVTPEHAVKLHLNKRDDAIYNKLLGSESFKTKEGLNKAEAESSIYQNYLYFYKVISDLDEAQIADVWSALERVVIVDLDVENENPQEIFESLNSTGLDLTAVDLLRNYLLMSLDHQTQIDFYERYWFKIEQNVNPKNMVRFFIDYLIYVKKSDATQVSGRRAHINENNLYSAFKSYYRSQGGTDDGYNCSPEVTELILDGMLHCSKLYKRLVFDDGIDMNKLKGIERSIYSIVYINESVTSRPILMYIMEKFRDGVITEAEAQTMVDACLALVFRSKVTRSTGINGQFAGNVLQRLPEGRDGSLVDTFWRALTSGSGRFAFPADAQFEDALLSRPIYDVLRSKGTKYMLYAIEQHSHSSKGLPRYDDSNITVEHIMPQTLSPVWEEYLGEDIGYYDDSLNKLGNLTLTSYNSEMRNKPYETKRSWYKESSFAETRRISEITEWTIDEITARSEKLAKQCLGIWWLPAEYQQQIDDSDEAAAGRRPPFRFSMIGLQEGDEIAFIDNPSLTVTVLDDSHVSFQDETYSLSSLAAKLLGKPNSNGIAGPLYFTYDGETLSNLRDEVDANVF